MCVYIYIYIYMSGFEVPTQFLQRGCFFGVFLGSGEKLSLDERFYNFYNFIDIFIILREKVKFWYIL